MNLQPYPEYKNSGVEWLGEVPSRWRVGGVRRIATVVNGGTPTPRDDNWNGDIAWATPVDLNKFDGKMIGATLRTITPEGLRSGSTSVPGNSVLLSTRAPIGYVALTQHQTAFNQGCKGLLPDPVQAVAGYLAYALLAGKVELIARGQGTTFLELGTGALSASNVPIPSVKEQRGIADYLDHATAEIDAFIADQNELIGLLNERRAATITQAVTKGLDPNAPMKDSGVEWLGDVPEHWVVGPTKFTSDIALGKMLQPAARGAADILGRYLRAANVQPLGRLALESEKEMWFSPAELARLNLLEGDVVIVEGGVGGFGRAAYIGSDLHRWAFQNSIIRLRPHAGHDGRFITYTYLHLRAVGYIHMTASVTSMPHFTAEKVEATEIAWAGYQEEQQIADYLDHETAEIDAAIADAKEAIKLSKERRAALISAAVTGKIDVRDHERAKGTA